MGLRRDRCKERVYGGGTWNGHRCYRSPVKDGFCKQHHPDSVKARQEKSEAAAQKKRENSPLGGAMRTIRELKKTTVPIDKLEELKAKWVEDQDLHCSAHDFIFDINALIDEVKNA